MVTAVLLLDSIRIVFGFSLFLLIPGFALSLALFPRSTDLSFIDRIVYSTVFSISSGIASIVFLDIVLGFDRTLENFILVIGSFSVLMILIWSVERLYLNSRFKKHPDMKILKDNRDLQIFYSREINAAKDLFRKDTRTMVVYHESRQSGIRHIDHSYLMDTGEEIEIRQVTENKLYVTESYLMEPPYPKTRYFEVLIREYYDEGLSQVDHLQIYPVLVTKNPKRTVPALQNDTHHITKRIYQKTNTTEIQWIYSHDFHIYAIIHDEDTLSQMVDWVLGKLDEIVIPEKNGIHLSLTAQDRQAGRDVTATVVQKPLITPSRLVTPAMTGTQAGVRSKSISQQQVTLPGTQSADILKKPEVTTGSETGKIPDHTGVHDQVRSKNISKYPENKLVIDSIRKLQKDILRDLDMFNLTTESFKGSRKNIENIRIPKKADINKKLADAKEEMKDLDWLYE
jgi:uncharacterized protein YhhL (DUF1145 family)